MKKYFYTLIILLCCMTATTVSCKDCCTGTETTDTLWINNGNRRIFGELHKPAKVIGTVIFAHGFNGTHRDGQRYYEFLGKLGYQCYAFDFPCGSKHSRSNNNATNMSVTDEVSDLHAIINHFKKQKCTGDIVVIGESQGGLVAGLAASETPNDINRLILIYPAFCIPGDWNKRFPDTATIPDTVELWGVKLGKRYIEQVRQLKPFEVIGKYKHPVLIIQGDKDPIVPMADSQRAQRIYKDASIHIIPEARHGFTADEFNVAAEQIKQFLSR